MTATGLLVRPVGAHADNDPINKTDPTGLRPGDLSYTDTCFKLVGVPGAHYGSINGGAPWCYAIEVTGTSGFGANPGEFNWCIRAHVIACHRGSELAELARQEASSRFLGQPYDTHDYDRNYGKGEPPDGSQGNAFMHMAWNALMVLELGPNDAKTIADNHETSAQDGGSPLWFRGMDYANNFYGRQISWRHYTRDPQKWPSIRRIILDEIERFVRDGSACWIDNYDRAKKDIEPAHYADASRCGLS